MTTDIEATSTRSLAALIFDDESAVTVGGLTLTERAVLLAHGAGLSPVRVWGVRTLNPASVERLRLRGVAVVQQPPDLAPLEMSADNEGVVVIGPGVLFGPEVLTVLTGGTGEAAAIYDAGAAPRLLYLSSDAKGDVRTCRSIETMVGSLSMRGAVTALSPDGAFCRRIDRANLAAAAERDYVRHLNGTGESYFTKKIRRFSVPLTSRLVLLGARPTHVTFGGLALAAASAWSMAQGSYVAGVLGALLYYTSMIFDCSDGEVARLTMRDSPFGAWLETWVDYLTYFLMLAALTAASQNRPGADAYRIAAMVALAGSIVVALVAGYLRHRVAAADPGQFDDASAKVLASSSRFHRFARWGRQWIKRSTLAHLVVVLALVNQLPALLYLWAFGATVASVVIVAVEPVVVRRVAVSPARVRKVDAGA
jgi:phosphatidylglycerophosphate synthase